MTLLGAIRHRISPLDGIMSATDYHRVNRSPALTAGTTRIAGRTIAYSDNNGVLHSAREIFRDEVYRFRARTDRPHIIDAGANIGLSVLYFKRMYPEATVIAFEPDAAIFALLQRNTAGLRDVELRQAAAWTEDTELTFYSEGSLAGSAELDYTGRQNATVVRAERLRDELEKRPVDFLKIDIEGAENTVLFDIEDRLDSVDHLFFEYHSNPDKPQLMGDLLNLVRRNGFRYTVNEAHGARLPFVERVEQGFDLQANVFCYRQA